MCCLKAKRSLCWSPPHLRSVGPLRNHLWSSLQAFPSPSQRPSPVCSGQMSMRSASRAQMLQTMCACCCRCRQRMSSLQGLRDIEVRLHLGWRYWQLPELDLEIPVLHMYSDIIYSVVVQRNGWLRRRLTDTCSAEFQVLKCSTGKQKNTDTVVRNDEGTSDPFVLVMFGSLTLRTTVFESLTGSFNISALDHFRSLFPCQP